MGFWEGNQTSVFIKFCSSPLLGNQCPTLPLTLVRQWRNHPSYWRFEWKRNSDCNTSYNPPVHKPNSNWRLTVNYWCLDSDLGPLTAAIPNIAELIATIQEQAHKITAPTDVKDMFFMVGQQEEDQKHCFHVRWPAIHFHSLPTTIETLTHSSTWCTGTRIATPSSCTGSKSIHWWHLGSKRWNFTSKINTNRYY